MKSTRQTAIALMIAFALGLLASTKLTGQELLPPPLESADSIARLEQEIARMQAELAAIKSRSTDQWQPSGDVLTAPPVAPPVSADIPPFITPPGGDVSDAIPALPVDPGTNLNAEVIPGSGPAPAWQPGERRIIQAPAPAVPEFVLPQQGSLFVPRSMPARVTVIRETVCRPVRQWDYLDEDRATRYRHHFNW